MLLILNTSRGLLARNNEMRTAKFYIFCSLSATELHGTVANVDVFVAFVCSLPPTNLHGTVAIVEVCVAFS